MKKIFCLLIFIIIFSVSYNSVKASTSIELPTLVILKDTTYSLELDGYILKENNVDIKNEGSYLARYVDSYDNSYYRVIEVVSIDTLESNMYIKRDQIKQYSLNKYDRIVKVISSSYGDIILKIIDGKYFIDFDFDQFYLTSDCIGFTTKLEVVDIYFDEALQICYGVANTKEGNIYLFMVGTNKEVLYFLEYGGSAIDSATFIYTTDEYIYIGGSTKSSDSDFFHEQNMLDSYILKIDKLNYKVINYIDLGLNTIDSIVYFDDINHLIIQSFKYNFNSIYNVYDLNTFEKIDELVFFNDFELKKIVSFDSKLYILGSDLEYYYLYEYKSQTTNLLFKEEINIIESIDMALYENEVRMYLIKKENSSYNLYLYLISQNLRKKRIADSINDSSIFTSKNYVYLKSSSTFTKYLDTSLYSKTLGSLSTTENIEPIMYLNGNIIDYDIDKSNTFIDTTHAGSYSVSYFYKTLNLECLLKKNVIVSLISNIKSNNTYLVGLILYTNLDVYINDELVSNGYIFDSIGTYHIKVEGQSYNDEFDINIIDYKEEVNTFDRPIQLVLIESDLKNDIPKLSIINKSSNIMLYETNYFDKLWYMLIPFAATFILGTIYFTIGRKWL